VERAKAWVESGARVSSSVKGLLRKEGVATSA
jgi:ribosomal protein S16